MLDTTYQTGYDDQLMSPILYVEMLREGVERDSSDANAPATLAPTQGVLPLRSDTLETSCGQSGDIAVRSEWDVNGLAVVRVGGHDRSGHVGRHLAVSDTLVDTTEELNHAYSLTKAGSGSESLRDFAGKAGCSRHGSLF